MDANAVDARAKDLLTVVDLARDAAGTVIEESRRHNDQSAAESAVGLPSTKLYQARQTLLAVAGKLTELASDPQSRLQEISSQYFESRALHICVEHRVPDLLDDAGASGRSVESLGAQIGIEPLKLSRVLRCLTSIGVFDETAPDVFVNNRVSASLVRNEPLRAYIMLFALDLFSAADWLPTALTDPVKGPSYDVDQTAFQLAVGTVETRWDWLEQRIPANAKDFGRTGYSGAYAPATPVSKTTASKDEQTNGAVNGQKHDPTETKARPELEIMGLAMVGGGRVTGKAHIFDFPWSSLGAGTVVDVGGGVGGLTLQLSQQYPSLNFVVQDRPSVLKQAETIWQKENPDALKQGRVKLMPHDFFQEQPVKGADVYWFRHDWADDYCVRILSSIVPAMGPNSRILIVDQIMNTTLGCPELEPAPSPLPANYGYAKRYSHQRDLCMMAIINGIERTPAQFKDLAHRAGLRIERIWECRSQVGIVECRRA
ncbi:MAG: hypothetical protein M1817_001703 [Caeruleum heppii]|nr:MAG: hypothetical protein M1817_001703 [Caeruleum heppii]